MKHLGVALVLVGLLAGCSGVGEGPLANDGGLAICAPWGTADREISMGAILLRNKGREPATITGVSAVDAVGLRVDEPRIGSADEGNFITRRGWEPGGTRPAVGYVVPADGSAHNVVLRVVKDELANEASLQGVRIDYAVGEQSYRTVQHSTLILRSTCS